MPVPDSTHLNRQRSVQGIFPARWTWSCLVPLSALFFFSPFFRQSFQSKIPTQHNHSFECVGTVDRTPVLAACQKEHLRDRHPSWPLAKSHRPKHLRGDTKGKFLTQCQLSALNTVVLTARRIVCAIRRQSIPGTCSHYRKGAITEC